MDLKGVSADAGVLRAVLTFAPDEPLRTSEVPGFASTAIAALPGLRGHRCDNGVGLTFSDELSDTEIAHFVEHAALEVMAMAGSSPSLRGATTWDFAADGRGVFRVSIAFDDETHAREALDVAFALACALVGGENTPDAEAAARRLRASAGR